MLSSTVCINVSIHVWNNFCQSRYHYYCQGSVEKTMHTQCKQKMLMLLTTTVKRVISFTFYNLSKGFPPPLLIIQIFFRVAKKSLSFDFDDFVIMSYTNFELTACYLLKWSYCLWIGFDFFNGLFLVLKIPLSACYSSP